MEPRIFEPGRAYQVAPDWWVEYDLPYNQYEVTHRLPYEEPREWIIYAHDWDNGHRPDGYPDEARFEEVARTVEVHMASTTNVRQALAQAATNAMTPLREALEGMGRAAADAAQAASDAAQTINNSYDAIAQANLAIDTTIDIGSNSQFLADSYEELTGPMNANSPDTVNVGDVAFITGENRMMIWDGNAWTDAVSMEGEPDQSLPLEIDFENFWRVRLHEDGSRTYTNLDTGFEATLSLRLLKTGRRPFGFVKRLGQWGGEMPEMTPEFREYDYSEYVIEENSFRDELFQPFRDTTTIDAGSIMTGTIDAAQLDLSSAYVGVDLGADDRTVVASAVRADNVVGELRNVLNMHSEDVIIDGMSLEEYVRERVREVLEEQNEQGRNRRMFL